MKVKINIADLFCFVDVHEFVYTIITWLVRKKKDDKCTSGIKLCSVALQFGNVVVPGWCNKTTLVTQSEAVQGVRRESAICSVHNFPCHTGTWEHECAPPLAHFGRNSKQQMAFFRRIYCFTWHRGFFQAVTHWLVFEWSPVRSLIGTLTAIKPQTSRCRFHPQLLKL